MKKSYLTINSDHEKVDIDILNPISIKLDAKRSSQINVSDVIMINLARRGLT